ncbi:MAG: hypothetical protein LUQ65_12475 [Candidatus Helarchaeota archaeon]|nr:hypothetical protein [Candidatus Helarchaeota archaeon]
MPTLECPLCHGTVFRREEASLHGKWEVTHHIAEMLICEKCKFIMLFSEEFTWKTGRPQESLDAEGMKRRP